MPNPSRKAVNGELRWWHIVVMPFGKHLTQAHVDPTRVRQRRYQSVDIAPLLYLAVTLRDRTSDGALALTLVLSRRGPRKTSADYTAMGSSTWTGHPNQNLAATLSFTGI